MSSAVLQVVRKLWLVFGYARSMQPLGFPLLPSPCGLTPTRSQTSHLFANNYSSAQTLINHFPQKKTRNKDPITSAGNETRSFVTLKLTNRYRKLYLLKHVLWLWTVYCAAKINLGGLASSQRLRAGAYSGYYRHKFIITF